MAVASFGQQLKTGRVGEGYIASWLISRGWHVLPVYDIEIDTGKGPRLFSARRELIATDMLVFNSSKVRWVEAKHKEAFSLHRITGNWVTGIDLHHYEHYQQIARISPWPVWLMFLQRGGQAKDSPPCNISGLFAGELSYLREHENHRHENWGKNGMVYWAHTTLRLIAPLEEVTGLRMAV